MKKEEVPQDESFLEKNKMRELCYAVDKDGNYTTSLSSGWEPKTVALQQALDTINMRAQEAKERFEQGISSPVEYYMELHRMDLPVLADYMGLWQWQVKRHCKPSVFNRLAEKTLQKYAATFGISLEALKNIK